MHYYVDGYNVLFRLLHAGDNLKEQREQFIEYFKKKVQALNLQVTLVFDSQHHPGESSRAFQGVLEIAFTSNGQTADEYILGKIDAEQDVVVTSDKKLAWEARTHFVKTETVEEFFSWLNKRYKNKIKRAKEAKIREEPLKVIAKPPAPVKKRAKPSVTATFQECFEYYLETFEERSGEGFTAKNLKSFDIVD